MAHQELEMMDFRMGKGDGYSTSSAVVPQFSATSPAYHYGSLPATADTGLPLDELLDFSNKDLFPSVASDGVRYYGTVANEPASFIADGSMTGKALSVPQFQNNSPFNLCIPQCEDAADLEWLSKFVEDSFSDAPCYVGFGAIAPSCQAKLRMDQSSASGRGARSKRSRSAAGTYPAADWSSLVVPLVQNSPSSSSSSPEIQPSKPKAGSAEKSNKGKKIVRDGGDGVGGSVGVEGGVRRCTHCASEKTPQWRTGPLGPKTLCNACGVRYKSGRLVPEYRPAASPTYVLTQHSNSHRKVMELRRQKEMLVIRHHEKATCVARPEPLLGDNGIC